MLQPAPFPVSRPRRLRQAPWIRDMVAETALGPADFIIEKVAYSAFYQTRLEFILKKMGIETLIVGGIVTNGGVASTLRDAHLRDIDTIMLTDGCAAFKDEVHRATITSLATVCGQMTCADATALVEGAVWV